MSEENNEPQGDQAEEAGAEGTNTNEGAPAEAAKTKGKKGKSKKKQTDPKPKKEAKSKVPKAPKEARDGVIKTILTCMQQDGGASAEEIIEVLKKKFPEKKADGMMTTIRIQVSRLPGRLGFTLKKDKVDGRGADGKPGLVYKAPKSARLDKPKVVAPVDTEKK